MKKLLFIYNPRAGTGKIRNSLSYILEEFASRNIELTVHPTSSVGDAVKTAREQGRAYDMIVCSGGDGTLDEVVTGMMLGGFRTPVGYIPAGSTNDYASSLGISTEMTNAARAIANGSVFSCDVGRMTGDEVPSEANMPVAKKLSTGENKSDMEIQPAAGTKADPEDQLTVEKLPVAEERFFVYVAAFGAFTEVSYKTSQDMKNVLGHLAYLLEGVRSLASLKSWKLRFFSQERSGEGEFLYGMVTNSNSVGGFKGITGNDVTLNDGLFEVTMILMPPSFVEWPNIINALLTGAKSDYVITFKTARLVVEGESPIAWTSDGEYGGTYNRIVIENMPRALPIILEEQPQDAIEGSGEEL